MQQGPGLSSPCMHTENPFKKHQVSSDACEQCADNAAHQQCSHIFADLTLAVLPQRISSSFSVPGEDCVADHCAAAASEAPAAMTSQTWRPQLHAYDQLPTNARVDRRLLHGCQQSVETFVRQLSSLFQTFMPSSPGQACIKLIRCARLSSVDRSVNRTSAQPTHSLL